MLIEQAEFHAHRSFLRAVRRHLRRSDLRLGGKTDLLKGELRTNFLSVGKGQKRIQKG
jgi:hypothetical protein